MLSPCYYNLSPDLQILLISASICSSVESPITASSSNSRQQSLQILCCRTTSAGCRQLNPRTRPRHRRWLQHVHTVYHARQARVDCKPTERQCMRPQRSNGASEIVGRHVAPDGELSGTLRNNSCLACDGCSVDLGIRVGFEGRMSVFCFAGLSKPSSTRVCTYQRCMLIS